MTDATSVDDDILPPPPTLMPGVTRARTPAPADSGIATPLAPSPGKLISRTPSRTLTYGLK